LESNWGRNVADLGLGSLGASLCARWLFDPNVIISNADHVWETGIFLQPILPNLASDPIALSTGFGLPQTNFPYGIPVEPFVRV